MGPEQIAQVGRVLFASLHSAILVMIYHFDNKNKINKVVTILLHVIHWYFLIRIVAKIKNDVAHTYLDETFSIFVWTLFIWQITKLLIELFAYDKISKFFLRIQSIGFIVPVFILLIAYVKIF